MMRNRRRSVLGAVLAGAVALPAAGQLRVAEWNVTNYGVPYIRDADFQTAIYGIAPNGLRFAPDVLLIQEVVEGSSGGSGTGGQNAAQFLAMLNAAPGSPGDWALAPYILNGGNSGNAMYYRTSKIVWMGTATLSTDTGTGATQAPRDNQRWQVRLAGYSGLGAQMYMYGGHFKASSGSANEARRLPEGRRLRIDANALPDAAHFLLCADMNVQDAFEPAYLYLTTTSASPPMGEEFLADPSGRFVDPINSPGSWENNGLYRYIHTQDPATQMDSRLDQILISGNLRDGQGLDYLPAAPGGNILLPYYTTSVGNTWNDPNHSYRAWGNDGGSYNTVLRTTGNTMVGPVIAQALVNTADGLGHLPVFLDVQVPAKASAPVAASFGTVPAGSVAQISVQIGNGADVNLWSRDGTGAGIDALTYTLSASAGFAAPGGTFNDAAGGGLNSHVISMNTSTSGPKTGTLTITSDDPDNPVLVVNLSGIVGSAADYDVNDDGLVNNEDLYRWYGLFTDVDGNGTVDVADLTALRVELRRLEPADMTAGLR